MKVAKRLSKVCRILPDVRLEVYLYDLLDDGFLDQLYAECVNLLKQESLGTKYKKPGKYIVMLSRANEERMSQLDKKKREEEAILFVTNITQKEGKKNVTTVGVPFADERAADVLRRKYHQLVDGQANIVTIDVSGIPKGIRNWPRLIKKRLQPKMNRKISAVLLCSSILSPAEGVQTTWVWIKNQYAYNKLDKGFLV